MAALITENFRFVSLFFKSKDVMIFNGLVALGTVASQTAYNVFAFHCPCACERNYLYGLAALGAPALALFIIGLMLNKNSWDLVSECRLRLCRKLSGAAAFALLASILGRAAVAPVTWALFSLLQGEAYVCALSEFVDPKSLENFPPDTQPEVMARFPCKEVPVELLRFWGEIERRLKYESQEAYWSQFRSSEQSLFQRTADMHARALAAESVKSFFGFVALGKEDKEQLEVNHNPANPQCNPNPIPSAHWNQITGVYLYRENKGLPLYSRLNKWAKYSMENNTTDMDI